VSNRLRPLNLTNFTGGINLRADAFQLAENESPDMLNVDVDPRGGFQSRRGWQHWNDVRIVDEPWDPRNGFLHVLSTGEELPYVANNGHLLRGIDREFAVVENLEEVAVPVTAEPHLADFVAWGDLLYVSAGVTSTPFRVLGAGLGEAMAVAETGTWQNDYTTPSETPSFPRSDLCASHSGYVFVASTREDSVDHPNRIRWSHPNDPTNWHENDFIDILEGGARITALQSFQDHLLIFKAQSVWALYGYDRDSWQLVEITRASGAASQQLVARSDTVLYYMSWPIGVFAYNGSGVPAPVSDQLKPEFQRVASIGIGATPNDAWLGWVNQKLWVTFPQVGVFVMDPSLNGGAWTKHAAADGGLLGPYLSSGVGGGEHFALACHQDLPTVVEIDKITRGYDELEADDLLSTPGGTQIITPDERRLQAADGDAPRLFESFYVTRWIDAGFPTSKKSWRRPDFIVKEFGDDYSLSVSVFRDFEEASPKRVSTVVVDAGGTGPKWGEFDWGDGTQWGEAPQGARIERGSGIGLARTVQLKIAGTPGKPWGVDAIVMKFVPRRFR
jgi:hypothetical protein